MTLRCIPALLFICCIPASADSGIPCQVEDAYEVRDGVRRVLEVGTEGCEGGRYTLGLDGEVAFIIRVAREAPDRMRARALSMRRSFDLELTRTAAEGRPDHHHWRGEYVLAQDVNRSGTIGFFTPRAQ